MVREQRLRFAPSPTGAIHIGNIRTALFNWLYARAIGAKFIVRIEDTDATRSEQAYEDVIFKELEWLGLDWDESPGKGGEYAPYRQSERQSLYQEYAEQLVNENKAYYCYCTEADLEQDREAQRARGEMPRYSGRCRELTIEERQECERQGKTPVIRFRVPEGETIQLNDIIKGEVTFQSDDIGDFIIQKSDGMPPYNFACVVDDYSMEITHVLRGEDHVSNTPRQIMLYHALEFNVPAFGHFSLILGSDKAPLSKRHGNTYIGQYREDGFLPEAMINFLALLGWSPEGEEELFTPEELTEIFDINRISKSAAVFDIDKLKWMNSHYIKESSAERILELSKSYITERGLLTLEEINKHYDWLLKVIDLTKTKLEYLAQIPSVIDIFFGDNILLNDEEQQYLEDDATKNLLADFGDRITDMEEFTPAEIKGLIKSLGKEHGLKGKKLFMPTRIAVSGQMHGPELEELIYLLGKEKVVSRINSALHQS